MKKIILATNNLNKVHEILYFLNKLRIQFFTQKKFNIFSPTENHCTFIENALLKARYASKITNLPAISEDSGICVDILNGQPGINSARYSGIKKSDKNNIEKLLSIMKKIPQSKRQVKFYCVLVYLRHSKDQMPFIAEGIWKGYLTYEEKGKNGFGYDSIFYDPKLKCTAAELSLEQKCLVSHRSQALRKLFYFFEKNFFT